MHILPQSYLSEFENTNGKIWANKFKNPLKRTPRQTSAGGICYRRGYFKMPIEKFDFITAVSVSKIENFHDLFVETTVNSYYERGFIKKLQPFKDRESAISINDKFELCEAMLHFMARNPKVRDGLSIKEHLIENSEEFRRELIKVNSEEDIAAIKEMGITFDDYLAFMKQLYITSLETADEAVLHNNFVIEQFLNNSPRKLSVLWRMVQGKWEVLEVKHPGVFIVTDNPGNFFSEKNQTTELSEPYEFYFPLNSSQLLRITTSKDLLDPLKFCQIGYHTIREVELNKINYALAENSTLEIYCSSQDIINHLRNRKYTSN